jgi:hypothetical protein
VLNFSFDRFNRYSKVKEWFDEMLTAGKDKQISLRTSSVQLGLVYRAILKAAYLKAFSIWGYDFIYTDTGVKLRDVFTKNKPHVLSNCGVFFHMDKPPPSEGLCYVFTPSALQSFVINMSLTYKETGISCGVSVLIPGPHNNDWLSLQNYQPMIDAQGTFQQGLIQLPESTLQPNNHFPYTQTWHGRHGFRIAGIHDKV